MLGDLPRASSLEITLETCTYPCHALVSWLVSSIETPVLRESYKTERVISKQYKRITKTNAMTMSRMKEVKEGTQIQTPRSGLMYKRLLAYINICQENKGQK